MELTEMLAKWEQLIKDMGEEANDYQTNEHFLIAWFGNMDEVREKIEKTDGKFMQVIFDDNDFGGVYQTALEFIWLNICYNSNDSLQEGDTIADIIIWLHNEGKLAAMVERVCYLVEGLGQVEMITRGIHLRHTDWIDLPPLRRFDKKHKVNWLDAKYKLHDNNEFTGESQNGEHICWNLETGKARSF